MGAYCVYVMSEATYTVDVTHGPTYQFVCNDCGRRVSRWETPTGNIAYTCDECDETYTLRGLGAYKVEKVRVD